jgi:hypothetical protein
MIILLIGCNDLLHGRLMDAILIMNESAGVKKRHFVDLPDHEILF